MGPSKPGRALKVSWWTEDGGRGGTSTGGTNGWRGGVACFISCLLNALWVRKNELESEQAFQFSQNTADEAICLPLALYMENVLLPARGMPDLACAAPFCCRYYSEHGFSPPDPFFTFSLQEKSSGADGEIHSKERRRACPGKDAPFPAS